MASTLTISLRTQDDGPTHLGVLARDHRGLIVIAREGPLHEPYSVGGYKRAAGLIIGAWFEPELFSDGDQAVHDLFEACTVAR